MSTIPELLRSAVQLHKGGQFDQARRIYEQLLELDPNHADALNLLGLIGWQTGQYARAVEHLRKAIQIDNTQAAFFANLGEAYRGLQRFDEAIENYQQAIRLEPSVAVAHLKLATLFERTGRVDRAIDSYERALQLEPRRLETLVRLGGVRKQQGNLAAAGDCYRRAILAHPASALAHFEMGNVCQVQGRLDDAIASYRQAIAFQSGYAEAECNLGNALRERGRLSEALAHLQHAAAQRPDMAPVHSNLGVVLQDLGRLDEARSCLERALELEPARAEFLFNMGTILKDQARVEEAIEWHDRALEAQPDFRQALCGRGTALLSLGRFAEGWAGYEYRVGCPLYDTLRFPQPLWDGSPLAGRRLLVHCEQGLGDTMQFIRYLPLVRKRVQNVTVAARASLVPLLEQSGYSPLVARDGPLPPFDVHAPLMSLPGIFGTQVDSVPAAVPYLSVDQSRVDRLRAELQKYPGFKVGIAWQGRPNFRGDLLRSIPLERFAPLAQVEGVRLLSLQKGPGAQQISALAGRFEFVDLAPALDNDGAFLDTAAVIQCLDLVISSDTAVAHLAGALGARVWVALSAAPDWRWMYGRDDSPWYPTLRLFRQSKLGEWPDVFERMAGELRKLAAGSSAP
ncbi:MAG: tetratricopeptide repeat protein [Pirellulales bacterium]